MTFLFSYAHIHDLRRWLKIVTYLRERRIVVDIIEDLPGHISTALKTTSKEPADGLILMMKLFLFVFLQWNGIHLDSVLHRTLKTDDKTSLKP